MFVVVEMFKATPFRIVGPFQKYINARDAAIRYKYDNAGVDLNYHVMELMEKEDYETTLKQQRKGNGSS